jgi:hypothetical protein
MTTINYENIFQKGVLVNITISCWEGRTKLTKEQLKDLPTEIVRGVTDLLIGDENKLLKEIYGHDHSTRGLVAKMAIPFPISGVYFIPATRLEALLALLETRKADRLLMITDLMNSLESGIEKFKEKFPEYYKIAKDKGKYPSKEELARKFKFDYRIFQISVPDVKGSTFITSDVYKQEMGKFQDEIDEMKREVVNTICNELLVKADRLIKQATDGKPNQKTLNSLTEFFGDITNVYSDFIDREDIFKAVDKFKKAVGTTTADDLRFDDDFKAKFAKKIEAVSINLKKLPGVDIKPARAIDF